MQRQRAAGAYRTHGIPQTLQRKYRSIVNGSNYISRENGNIAGGSGRARHHDDSIRIAQALGAGSDPLIDFHAEYSQLRNQVLFRISHARYGIKIAPLLDSGHA